MDLLLPDSTLGTCWCLGPGGRSGTPRFCGCNSENRPGSHARLAVCPEGCERKLLGGGGSQGEPHLLCQAAVALRHLSSFLLAVEIVSDAAPHEGIAGKAGARGMLSRPRGNVPGKRGCRPRRCVGRRFVNRTHLLTHLPCRDDGDLWLHSCCCEHASACGGHATPVSTFLACGAGQRLTGRNVGGDCPLGRCPGDSVHRDVSSGFRTGRRSACILSAQRACLPSSPCWALSEGMTVRPACGRQSPQQVYTGRGGAGRGSRGHADRHVGRDGDSQHSMCLRSGRGHGWTTGMLRTRRGLTRTHRHTLRTLTHTEQMQPTQPQRSSLLRSARFLPANSTVSRGKRVAFGASDPATAGGPRHGPFSLISETRAWTCLLERREALPAEPDPRVSTETVP